MLWAFFPRYNTKNTITYDAYLSIRISYYKKTAKTFFYFYELNVEIFFEYKAILDLICNLMVESVIVIILFIMISQYSTFTSLV